MPRTATLTPRQYAKREVKSYQNHVDMHKASLTRVDRALQASDFMTTTAIVAASSAATMGLASYLSTTALATRFGTWIAGFAGSTPASTGVTVATFTRTSAALRTIARVATASSASGADPLTAAEISAAYTGIAARVAGGLAVGMTTSCIQRGMSDRKFTAGFVGTAIVENLFLAVLLGWAGSPGKSVAKVKLSERLAVNLPGWRHLATSRPSRQFLASGAKVSWVTFRKILGTNGLEELDKELKKSGSSIQKAMDQMAGKVAKEMHYLSLQAWAQLESQIRARQRKVSYRSSVSFVAKVGHAIREATLGDARIASRIKLERTELAVAVAGRNFWTAATRRLQDLHVAKKYSLKRMK